jgi:hypothetical protein
MVYISLELPMLTTVVKGMKTLKQNGAQPEPVAMGPSTAVKRAVYAIEFARTAIRLGSEIALFIGAMGFFISPPFRKMWQGLQAKVISYSTNISGDLYATLALQPNTAIPTTIEHRTFNDLHILEKDIPFDMSYPEGIFFASTLISGLGLAGIIVSWGLKRGGSFLLERNNPSIAYSQELVLLVEKRKRGLYYGQMILLSGSRVLALYATATFNMVIALSNVSSIMDDFSINSQQTFQYNPPKNDLLLQSASIILNINTFIGLADLRQAAINGSEEINRSYLWLAYLCAILALVLGFTELKVSQYWLHDEELRQRHKHYGEIEHQQMECAELTVSQYWKRDMGLRQRLKYEGAIERQNTSLSIILEHEGTLAEVGTTQERCEADGSSQQPPHPSPKIRDMKSVVGISAPDAVSTNQKILTTKTPIPRTYTLFSNTPMRETVAAPHECTSQP